MVKKDLKKTSNQKGFLENIKDLGGKMARSAAKDVLRGTVEEAIEQIKDKKNRQAANTGVLEEKKPFNFEEYIKQKEQTAREETQRFYERKKAHERIIWTAEQQQTERQIKAIQEELRKVVEETEELSQEVKRVAIEAVVEPGVYHLNFLERIWQLIKFLRKKIQESRHWLAEWNAYCKKKRNYYWIQVRQSGTKFMLSSERYMATQAG